MVGTRMVEDGRTAREIFDATMANPARARFGFGMKLAIVNVDLQQAYTRTDLFRTAYETDPRQIEHINTISRLARDAGMPVVWSRVAYKAGRRRRGRLGHAHRYRGLAPEHRLLQRAPRLRSTLRHPAG